MSSDAEDRRGCRLGGGLDEPGMYRIRTAGRLSVERVGRLGDLEVIVRETGDGGAVTELTGLLPDQAALHGLLNQLYARGIVLLRVEKMG